MGIGNILMLCQVTAYLMCAIFSIFVFAPMAVNKNSDFKGNCLLFPTGHVDRSTSSELLITAWGSPGGCNFAITMGILALLVSIAQLIRLSFHVFYETDSSFIGAFGTFIGNIILSIMLFISAINVTEGYAAWCQLINQISSCSLAGFEKKIWAQLPYIKPDNYAVELGMVQFGLWAELLLWTFLCIFSIIKLIKYNQQESIIRSLSRERQRLLGQYNQPDF